MWDRIMYLMVRKASNGLDYSDIGVFTSSPTTPVITRLIDTIESILYRYQDTTLSNVQDYPTVFSITRGPNNETYVNGQLVVNGNVRVALYKLSASAIKTLVTNSVLFSNIVNDTVYDPSVTDETNTDTQALTQQITQMLAQLTTLTSTVVTIDTRVTNLQNGLISNDSNDVTQLGAINQLQLTKVNTSTTINGHRLDTPAITLTAADVGLGNVTNSSPLDAPVSTATQTALNGKVDKTTTINGVALGSSAITLTRADIGLGNVDNTSDANKPVSSFVQTALNDKVDKLTTVNNKLLTSNITLTAADVGLGNVDNTADLAKPVSTATQVSLNSKVDKSVTVNNQPLSSNVVLTRTDIGLDQVDNTADLAKPVSLAQQFQFGLKVDKSIRINTYPLSSDVTLTKSDIGLANVDNVSDMDKPVSTAVQTALAGKVDTTRTVNSRALTTDIVLVKADVGLGNVDNTSDVNKPVSAAAQVKFDSVNNAIDVLSDLVDIKADKFVTINGYSISSDIQLQASDIAGLDLVDNTSDANKPLSLAAVSALAAKEDKAAKNAVNGYAGLDASGRLSLSVMPPVIGSSLLYLGTWNASTNTPAIASGVGTNGHYYKVAVAGSTSVDGTSTWQLGDWIIFNGSAWQRVINADNVSSVNGRVGNVVIVKADVGLGNVDNTSDASKPVSTLVQTALDTKLDKLVTFVQNNLARIGAGGILVDSNVRIDDTNAAGSSSALWTSQQVNSAISSVSRVRVPDFAFSTYTPNLTSAYGNALKNYALRFGESESRVFAEPIVPPTNAAWPYAGSVYSPFENRVYFVPYSGGTLHYVECASGAIVSMPISNLVASSAYIGGAYSPTENRIYFAPHNQTGTLHYIDCTLGQVVEYAQSTSGVRYHGAVYSPRQNRIYFIGSTPATSWLYVDCSTSSIGTFTHGITYATRSFAGGVYSPANNRIYLVPHTPAPSWYYVDCTVVSSALVSFTSGATITSDAYIGGVYVPDNNSIYFVPYAQRTNLHVLDCASQAVSTYAYTGTHNCAGGVYVPGGRVVFVPNEAGSPVHQVNTRDSNSIQTIGSSSTVLGESYGATYVPSSSRVYLSPANQAYWYNIQILDNNGFSSTLASGALFNKL